MFTRKFLITCMALFVLCNAHTQESSLQKLDSLAGRYVRALQSIQGETIYLQTDRPVYRVGDIIWFKAFVMNKISQKPSKRSSILFVDMVDDRDSILKQCLLNASLFKTDGSFVISDTLPTGHYWLRAYTRHTLSEKENPMYVQAVYVINSLKPDSRNPAPNKNKVSQITSSNDSVHVQYFPEGGTVVGGTNTVIVIKTTGIRNIVVKGFHVPENFEQRDYSVKENKVSKIPDSRSLIYWNGDGLTDANGKSTFSFYTADAATTYTVSLKGITAGGYQFQKQIQILRK